MKRAIITGALVLTTATGAFAAGRHNQDRIWAQVKCSHLTETTASHVTLTKWGDVDHVVYRCNADL
jgi:hypothetical protein